MSLFRKIENDLLRWKTSDSALIVYGPRQVGKTYTIKEFIKNFNSSCYLNFHNNLKAIKSIIESKDIDDFLLRISLLCNERIYSDTCIFIDEIQEYYTYLNKHRDIEEYFDIIYQTKNFVERKKQRIILSGSLLRLELDNLITSPTGYLLKLEMYPLDFEEFLINNKVTSEIIEIVKKSIKNEEEVPNYIHEHFMSKFNEYLLVGGMPKAVEQYLTKHDFLQVEDAHNEIESYIVNDIMRYASDNEKLKVKEIYKLIPTELSNPSRKFILSDISEYNKNNKEILSFTWLNNAGITIPTYLVSNPTIPLVLTSKRNQFKLFFEDVGLLSYKLFDSDTKLSILNNNIKTNNGFIYENFVAQELHAHGFSDLYYYNNKKNGEVDFLVEYHSEVLPIEVKSGNNNTFHRALNTIIDIDEYNFSKAIVLTKDNFKKIGKFLYLPIYAISFLYKRK